MHGQPPSTETALARRQNSIPPGLRFDIVGVGLAGWDISLLVPTFPIDDRTHVLAETRQGGGMAANALVTARRLGFTTALATTLGDDEVGGAIRADLAQAGVCTNYLTVIPGQSSPTAYCLAERTTGRKMILGVPATVTPMTARTAPAGLWRAIENARVLHVDGWHPDATLEAMARARRAGVTISYDAGHLPEHASEMLRRSDLVIASAAFAREFFGREPDEPLLREIQSMGPTTAAVTLGENGVIARDGDCFCRLGVFDARVVDTTGAGDAFHGGFLAATLRGRGLPFQDCLRFATAVAAMGCRKLSPRGGLPPSWGAVSAFMRRHVCGPPGPPPPVR